MPDSPASRHPSGGNAVEEGVRAVRSSALRLSVSRQLSVILVLYLLSLGLLAFAGEVALAVHRQVAATFDPETRADPVLLKYATTGNAEEFNRYLEELKARTGPLGRRQLSKSDPNFDIVYSNLRERLAPDWVAQARGPLSAVLPEDVLQPTVALEAEGARLLERLAAVTGPLQREVAAGGQRPARLRADAQRRLAELAAVGEASKAAEVVVATRVRRWQRDVFGGVTAGGFALALLVGFLSTTAVRRAAARLGAHVSEMEQGNFQWRLASAPGDDLAPVVAAFNEMAANVQRAARKAEEDARQAGKALRDLDNIMETIPDVICILDLIGRLDLWNRSLERATGLAQDALAGCPMLDLFSEDDRSTIEIALRRGLSKGHFEVEGNLRGPDGEGHPYHWTGAALKDAEGVLIGLTVSGRDITDRKALEQKLAHQAFHDPLTSLPNRALFMNRLSHALRRAGRRPGAVAVLFLDLDRFKVINDSLGHQVGDFLLMEVSSRLRTCLRPADTVARLGGDEFALLLEDIVGVNEATQVAERIAAGLEEPFVFEGREMSVTTSMGIALSHPNTANPEEILRDADIAMYQAKSKGKARYEVFDDRSQGRALDRLDLEIDLRGAVTRHEFRLHYQPMVDLRTGRIVEVEALIRWQHPQRGLISPSEFITLSEETGLIVPIGMWVLEEACRQVRAWQEQYEMRPPLVLSVNLSACQFQQPTLVGDIAGLLVETGLPPASLKLEITESVVMQDVPTTLTRLKALKKLGVQLAVDDFGTGYSSLNYLKSFPIDSLKIDQGFVRGLGENPDDTAIVRAIVTVAKHLDLSVTAEGIETAEQLARLCELDCDRGQGYYFARPLPAEDLPALFARDLTATTTGPLVPTGRRGTALRTA